VAFPRLTREQMLDGLDSLLNPRGRKYSSQQYNNLLLTICANSPDPVTAMRLILNAESPITAGQLLNSIVELPPRPASEAPASELPLTHPLRHTPVETLPSSE